MKEALKFPVMRIAGTGSSGKASVINWGMKAILPVEKKNNPLLTVENFCISFYESEVTNHHSLLTHNTNIKKLLQAIGITNHHITLTIMR